MNRQKTIAFDLDGVFYDQEGFQLKHGIKFFQKKYVEKHFKETGKKIKYKDVQVFDEVTNSCYENKLFDPNKPYIKINSNGYNIKETFLCTADEQKEFWYKYMIPYGLTSKTRKDVKTVIGDFYDEDHKIVIITARAKADENSFIGSIQRSIVKLRLKIAGIPYDAIEFCPYANGTEAEAKITACQKHKVDIMIEDKKTNAIAIENKTSAKSFLYASRNNSSMEEKDVPRYISMLDLNTAIRKYLNNQTFKTLNRHDKEKLTNEEREKYYEDYRKYLKNTSYNKEAILERKYKLNKLIKRGSPLFDKIIKYETINTHRIPEDLGNTIITTNHTDLIDIPLVIRTLGPGAYHPMLKSDFLNTIAEGPLTEINSIWVKREDKSVREQARENAVKRMLHLETPIQCPEGTRNKTDRILLDFDYGAVSSAQISGGEVYPMAIKKIAGKKIVNCGSPIKVSIHDDLSIANEELRNQTIALLEEIVSQYGNAADINKFVDQMQKELILKSSK